MVVSFILLALTSSVPAINLAAVCHVAQSSVRPEERAKAYADCLQDEEDAKARLQFIWPRIAGRNKQTCIHMSTTLSPSYVELLTCIETLSGLDIGPMPDTKASRTDSAPQGKQNSASDQPPGAMRAPVGDAPRAAMLQPPAPAPAPGRTAGSDGAIRPAVPPSGSDRLVIPRPQEDASSPDQGGSSIRPAQIEAPASTPGQASADVLGQKSASAVSSVSATPAAKPSLPAAPPIAFPFAKDLKLGMIGADVGQLQEFLNAHGFPVADAGPGSPGHESWVFGPKTKAALMKFQTAFAKEILSSQGLTSATGFFGPATRQYMNKERSASDNTRLPATTLRGGGTEESARAQNIASNSPPPAARLAAAAANSTSAIGASAPTAPGLSPPPRFSHDLELGSVSVEVKRLQIFLNTHGFPVASTGPGSPGNENDVFGPATRAALIKFQAAHAKEVLLPLGLREPTGRFGAATRQYINSLRD